MDFIFADLSSDDVYPIFKKMARQKLPVHYITEKPDIFKEYCNNISIKNILKQDALKQNQKN